MIRVMLRDMFALFMFSSIASAYDFSAADASYKDRDNNLSAIANAKHLYRDALHGSTTKQEKIHAAEQLGKLAFYEGELMLGEDEHDKRVHVFNECMSDMDQIKPDLVGETATYFMFKGMCLAFWGKSVGMFSAAARVGELKGLINDGLRIDANYEGGGFHRLYAGVYIKSRLMGLYDLQGALDHINKAIEVGPDYYNSYLLKADVLKEMGRTNEAIDMLGAVNRNLKKMLRNNRLPAGLEPETKIVARRLAEKLDHM